MSVCTPISTCAKNVVGLVGNVQKQRIIRSYNAFQKSSCYCCTFNKNARLSYFTTNASNAKPSSTINCTDRHKTGCHSLTFESLVSPRRYRRTRVDLSAGYENLNLRLLMPKQAQSSKVECNVGPFSWRQRTASTAVFIGFVVCFSTSQPSYAESREGNGRRENSSAGNSNNKKVLTDCYIIGIPGDGRCLFRSVVHGACV